LAIFAVSEMAFYYEFGIHQWIVYSVTFIYLLIASISDLRTREVYDWLNYGAVASGLGINLIFTLANFDYMFAFKSLLGFGVFFVIAYALFYTGQWGGGDSKILMGLGAMIGIDVSFKTPQFLAWFFINALVIGAIYGLFWSMFLVFKNRKKFSKEFKKILLVPSLCGVTIFLAKSITNLCAFLMAAS